MNPYLEIVDTFKLRARRFPALLAMTDGRVRGCCLALLDQHPDPDALPHIVTRWHDPVPRVRWHAVHALLCDACKPGAAYVCDADIIEQLHEVAARDPSAKVRAQAAYGLEQMNARPRATSSEES